ncbi:MAG: trehalase family glycosidase [Armatimonadota bacterium]|nr:trehalase family glycosidase [Armatimonadota bacterium]
MNRCLRAVLILAVFTFLPSYADISPPVSEHLVAWYKMNEGKGNVIHDSIQPSADGELNNGNWAPTGGVIFNGNGNVQIGSAPKLLFRSNFTLAARIKSSSTSFGQIVGSAGAGGLVFSTNQLKFAIWGHDWHVEQFLPEDQWLHIAVTMDEEQNARMYVNGSEVGASRVMAWPKDPDNWTIGGWNVGEGFRGIIADVMIYNIALNKRQVKELAAMFGLDKEPLIPIDERAPLNKTPKSVREMAKILAPLALEPDLLPRYPFSAMMGGKRFAEALRIHKYADRTAAEKWLADNIPTFDCPDAKWTRCWYYRWFLVRVNYQEEDGIPGFYEGKRGGYTRHITYSAPHIMDEVRWLRDGKYAYGQAEILGKRREPNGRRFGGYTHWISSTLWNTYLVHPDKKRLAKLLPAWAEDTECAFPGKLDTNRPLRDYLLNPPSHWATGMEWQPAWFYFDNYDRSKETNLYRPDYTAYYYANARAVANMYRELGDTNRAKQFDALADKIKEALNTLMWDADTNFFYSIKTGTDDQKAMVKEIVGIYPFAFEVPEKTHVRAFESILNPEEFWGPWKLTTCTMKCPMFTPKVVLCNWNGPIWPHANSIVANALAQGIRRYMAPAVTRKHLWELLDSYTNLHYEDKGIWKQPNIREEGNADDGQMFGCPDYFHSTYNNLIITLVGGLVPRNDDKVELFPVVDIPWDYFRLDKIPYKGHQLTIVFDLREDGKRYKGCPKGYSLFIDGKLVATKPKLERMTAKLPSQ